MELPFSILRKSPLPKWNFPGTSTLPAWDFPRKFLSVWYGSPFMTFGSFHFLDGSCYAIKQFGTPMLNTWKLHVSCGTSLLQSGNSNIFLFFNISIRYIIKCLFPYLVTNFIFSNSVKYMKQI